MTAATAIRSAAENTAAKIRPKPRHTIEKYAPGYIRMWGAMQTRPEYASAVGAAARRVLANKERYVAIEAAIGVPWFFVGIVHKMECNCDFSKHLHNGDSLNRRTWRVPAGRPLFGSPPYDWGDSAIDALKMKGLQNVKAWTLERIAFELERYNGFGYRPRNIPSAYLWSFSNHYARGKFVKDGVWDSRATSTQTGALVVLRRMAELDSSIAVAPGISAPITQPLDADENERLPPTPSAWRVLARSRTLIGSAVAAIGASVSKLAEWLGPTGDILASVAEGAEGLHGPALQIAGYVGASLPWIGAAAVAYGLFMAVTARVQAESEGKIG